MRDTKSWEAGKGLLSPIQPPCPSGGLCSQQHIQGWLGWSEDSPFTSLSSHILPIIIFIISIAECPPSSSCLLHWELDSRFSCPKESCVPLGSNGCFTVFKVSWGIKMSQKCFPQEQKAMRKLSLCWGDDQIPRILLCSPSVKFLLTRTGVYLIRTMNILFRIHDSGHNWNRCLSTSHGNNGALLL